MDSGQGDAFAGSLTLETGQVICMSPVILTWTESSENGGFQVLALCPQLGLST